MPTTTAKQKLYLIIFGISLTLVLLEIALRIGGFLFTLHQDWRNRQALFKNRSEFRILCIGESTTALGGLNSYPAQLEDILNKQGLKQRFKVINKGLISKTSTDILAELEGDLKRYQPDLVISMIGVNDSHNIMEEGHSGWLQQFLQKFRLYHFFKLLGMHLSHRMQHAEDKMTVSPTTGNLDPSIDPQQNSLDSQFSPAIDDNWNDPQKVIEQMMRLQTLSAQVENYLKQNPQAPDQQELKDKLEIINLRILWFQVYLGSYYRMHGDFRQSHEYLSMALAQDPNNYGPYLEFGRLYREQKNYKSAIIFLQRARDLMPVSDLALLELGRCYDALGQYEETFKFYKLLFEKNSPDFWIYPEIGTWFKEHHYLAQAEEVFLQAIKMNPKDHSTSDQLAGVYEALGKNDQAQAYHKQAAIKQAQAEAYLPGTLQNYNKIVDCVLSRGIKLICMQYPRRNIGPLKKFLKNKDKIIFVENKTNFEEALRTAEYSRYFSDNFGGDFGHCTRRGNELITQNLARAIVNHVLKN